MKRTTLMISMIALASLSLASNSAIVQAQKKAERGVIGGKDVVAVVVAERILNPVGGAFLEMGAQCFLRPRDTIDKIANVTDQGPHNVLARRLRRSTLAHVGLTVPDSTICPGGTRFYTTSDRMTAWKANADAQAANAKAAGKRK